MLSERVVIVNWVVYASQGITGDEGMYIWPPCSTIIHEQEGGGVCVWGSCKNVCAQYRVQSCMVQLSRCVQCEDTEV